MNFKAGDKVVCVDDSIGKWSGRPLPIVKGEVYCVRASCGPDNGYESASVLLVGIYLGTGNIGLELSLYSDRFRLVSEVKLIMEAVRKNAIGKEVETHTVAQP